ncbi:hypothetical protein SIO70_27190 [Chitinophaga sancti]|uniref:hypothetical protein n=1 Tax=Chitinophaga sancti TaxID=1004 RepID=UPI002A7644F5|nr:hypothetical protein [Chitinophaga sancti]WPQ62051.1 hypothetical protein SIO70_27190 [Chitinophaga sancti]
MQFKKTPSLKLLRAFIFSVIVSLAFSSCSKNDEDGSDSSSDYYFIAAIDGRKVNFHTVNFQGGGNDNRWEHIVVGGYETSYPTSGQPVPPSLDFEIWRLEGNITVGTYSTPVEEKMIARYAVQTSEGTLLYNTSFANDVFTLKIEAISKQGIKGTFSGTVRNMAGVAICISDGSFNLPYETIVNP